MTEQKHRINKLSRHLLFPAFVAIAFYVLLPQIGDFRSSRELLSHPNLGLSLLAAGFTLATFLIGTATYCFLSLGRLDYGRTLLVQLASTFVNRLLPAGIGALGANYMYLRHERYGSGRAGSIVAMNNLLGFIGHMALVAVAAAVYGGPGLDPVNVQVKSSVIWKVGVILLVIALIAAYAGKKRLALIAKGVKSQALAYRKRPKWLIAAALSSLALTLCNVLCLYYCLHALGTHLTFVAVLLVFTLGVGAGSVVPTPGGLGGFEAGLTAGFVAYGVAAAPALAAALLYRLISYWLPMIVGSIAFVVAERRGLFRSQFG